MKNQRLWCSAKDAKLKVTRQVFADGKESPIAELSGYPITWGTTSSDRGGYQVRLARDSAKFTAAPLALLHHDFTKPLASVGNDTLKIGDADDYGIPVTIQLDLNTTLGRDTYQNVKSQLIGGMSFSMANGFEEFSETEKDEQTGGPVVTVSKYTVDEVTITAIPAFTEATIAVKQPDKTTETPAGGMSAAAPDRIAASVSLARLRLQMNTLEM